MRDLTTNILLFVGISGTDSNIGCSSITGSSTVDSSDTGSSVINNSIFLFFVLVFIGISVTACPIDDSRVIGISVTDNNIVGKSFTGSSIVITSSNAEYNGNNNRVTTCHIGDSSSIVGSSVKSRIVTSSNIF